VVNITEELGISITDPRYSSFIGEGRLLVCKGVLRKQGVHKADQEHMFYLFSDCLVNATAKGVPAGRHTHNLQRIVPIDDHFSIIRKHDTEVDAPVSWTVINTVQSFVLICDNKSTAAKWEHVFSAYQRDDDDQLKMGDAWVPDHHGDDCFLCTHTQHMCNANAYSISHTRVHSHIDTCTHTHTPARTHITNTSTSTPRYA
jgi:hypothetical protein